MKVIYCESYLRSLPIYKIEEIYKSMFGEIKLPSNIGIIGLSGIREYVNFMIKEIMLYFNGENFPKNNKD